MGNRSAALALALAVDAAFGEPGGGWHPVALAGRLLEAAYRPWRRAAPGAQVAGGTAALAAVVGLAAGFAAAGVALARRLPAPALALALLVKPTLSLRSLLAEASGVAGALERGDLDGARLRLRSLVSRPAAELGPELIASAAIESVAENLADSVVAPVLYFLVFGLPGAAAYRVVNTADAMVGYRGDTEWLGRTAARVDDVLGWAPSRLSALALIGAAGIAGGRPAAARAAQVWRRDGGRTASPNGGRPMAAMAGALGRRLEKPGHHVLGAELAPPDAAQVRAAVRLTALAAAIAAAAALALGAWRR